MPKPPVGRALLDSPLLSPATANNGSSGCADCLAGLRGAAGSPATTAASPLSENTKATGPKCPECGGRTYKRRNGGGLPGQKKNPSLVDWMISDKGRRCAEFAWKLVSVLVFYPACAIVLLPYFLGASWDGGRQLVTTFVAVLAGLCPVVHNIMRARQQLREQGAFAVKVAQANIQTGQPLARGTLIEVNAHKPADYPTTQPHEKATDAHREVGIYERFTPSDPLPSKRHFEHAQYVVLFPNNVRKVLKPRDFQAFSQHLEPLYTIHAGGTSSDTERLSFEVPLLSPHPFRPLARA